MTNGIYVR